METIYGRLERQIQGDTGTFGLLTIPGMTTFHTGELPWRDNAPGLSCIPAGTYMANLVKTEKHPEGIYMLENVPNRQDVEIHNGNWCGDVTKGYKSNVEGCILLGFDYTDDLGGQPAVTLSMGALAKFMQLMAGNTLSLEIVDVPASA